MYRPVFSNNAKSTLLYAMADDATWLQVASGEGSLFPSPDTGDYFPIRVYVSGTPATYEIMKCTSRTGDKLVVTRAQEGTSALAWDAGCVVVNCNSSGTMAAIVAALNFRIAGNLPGTLLSDSFPLVDVPMRAGDYFPAGLANCYLHSRVAPASDQTFTLYHGDAEFGTAILAAGSTTATLASTTAVTFANDEAFRVLGPSSNTDGTMENFRWLWCGQRIV